MKKRDNGTPPAIALAENPDILSALAHHKKRPSLVIGFAAETDDLLANAAAKRAQKGCDWIVANDVTPASGIMGGDQTHVHLITATDTEIWPRHDQGRDGAPAGRAHRGRIRKARGMKVPVQKLAARAATCRCRPMRPRARRELDLLAAIEADLILAPG